MPPPDDMPAVLEQVESVRDKLRPFELNYFECAKENYEDIGRMTFRQSEFVKWLWEKYYESGAK